MKKEIVISVIAGIIVTILITISAGWFNNQKNEIITSLSNIIDKKTSKISEEIKKERRSRAELAATLLKSGLHIPTKLLISFSDAEKDLQAKNILLSSLSNDAFNENINFVDIKKKLKYYNKVGRKTLYLARINDQENIIAFPNLDPSSNRGIDSISIKNNCTISVGSINFNAIEFKNSIALLNNNNITANNVITVPVKFFMKNNDPSSALLSENYSGILIKKSSCRSTKFSASY